MAKIRHWLLYYGLLSKRFFKKKSFLLLLCAVPLLVAGVKGISANDSGVISIVLCLEEDGDAFLQELTGKLLSSNSVVQYTQVETREDAVRQVESGKADAAWIFCDDFQEKLEALVTAEGILSEEEGPILVIERENNVVLQLSEIKMFAEVFPSVAYSLYRDFLMEDLGLEGKISEEELYRIYENNRLSEGLFQRVYADSEREQNLNYMTAPLRGMLALFILLCGLAATLFFMQDEERGMLDSTPCVAREKLFWVYQLAALIPVAVVVLAALALLGDAAQPGQEIVWMAFYLASCMIFCKIMKNIFSKAGRLGTCIPVLMLVMFVFCPVFITVRWMRGLQLLLPPYLYLTGVGTGISGGTLFTMLLYILIGSMLLMFWNRVRLGQFGKKR